MANLIITIIAIALVAVMAIAGIWYGSSAFQEAQAKAYANAIIKGGNQVVGALTARRGMLGAQTPFTTNDTDSYGGLNGLSPEFLSSFPSLPTGIVETTALANGNTHQTGWRLGNFAITDGIGTILGWKLMIEVRFLNASLALKVCDAVNAAQGIPSGPPRVYPVSATDPGYYNWYLNYGSKYKIHCNFRDADNSGTYGYVANTEMYRVYFIIN